MSLLFKVGAWLFTSAAAFFGPAANSIKGHVNVAELLKSLVTALATGSGALGVLTSLLPFIGVFIPNAGEAAVATAVLTAIIDVIRRLGHGVPAPVKLLR